MSLRGIRGLWWRAVRAGLRVRPSKTRAYWRRFVCDGASLGGGSTAHGFISTIDECSGELLAQRDKGDDKCVGWDGEMAYDYEASDEED